MNKLVFAAAVLVSGLVARDATAVTVESPSFLINKIETGWNAEGFVIAGGGGVEGGPCNDTNEYGVSISRATYRDILSIALAAQLAGRPISLLFDNTQCAFAGRKYVQAIRLEN